MTVIFAILIPFLFSAILFACGSKFRFARHAAVAAAAASLILSAAAAYMQPRIIFPWLGGVFDFILNADSFSSLMAVLASALSLLSAFYAFYSNKPAGHFQIMLFAQASAIGALYADSLAAMAFFTGMLPLSVFFAHSEKAQKNSNDPGIFSLTAGISAFILLVAGISIIGYISGTMNISEIASSKITLNYGWSASAFVLAAIASFYFMGIFPFSVFREKEISGLPFHLRIFYLLIYFIAGTNILIRFIAEISVPGSTARLIVFGIGIIAALIASIIFFSDGSENKFPLKIMAAQAGIAVCAAAFAQTQGAALMLAMMAVPAVFGFAVAAEDLRSIPAGRAILLAYIAALASLPPFGDALRQEMSGLIGSHSFMFLLICLAQAIFVAALAKFFFTLQKEGNGTDNFLPSNAVIAFLPLLFLLLCGFGGKMAEHIFVLPSIESLGLDISLLPRGTANVYMSLLLTILFSLLICQAAEAYSAEEENGGGENSVLMKAVKFLRNEKEDEGAKAKRNNPSVQQGNRKSLLKMIFWDWPYNIFDKMTELVSPAAECSLNVSMAAAAVLAAAGIILAAMGLFN